MWEGQNEVDPVSQTLQGHLHAMIPPSVTSRIILSSSALSYVSVMCPLDFELLIGWESLLIFAPSGPGLVPVLQWTLGTECIL